MGADKKVYAWNEIENVPAHPGIYAWYYKHTLTDFDIDKLVHDLAAAGSGSPEAPTIVRRFLETHLFEAFAEEPYNVKIAGPLKPEYEGQVANVASISSGLIARIIADPCRLTILKRVLEGVVPEFASPVYIGMSDSLRSRLGCHKRLIEEYKQVDGRLMTDDATTQIERADQSFARQVVRRGFVTSRLSVSVRIIETSGDVHLDAENILNRINFPLCGRN